MTEIQDYKTIFDFSTNTLGRKDPYGSPLTLVATLVDVDGYTERNDYIRTILTSLKIKPGTKSEEEQPYFNSLNLPDIDVHQFRAILFYIDVKTFNDLIQGIAEKPAARNQYVLPTNVLPKFRKIVNQVLGEERNSPYSVKISELKAIECFHRVSCSKPQTSGGGKKKTRKTLKTLKTRKMKRTKKSKKITKRK